ncbi:hypothetical protein [Flavobacterium cerinum]|uniref:Uncharacterized protein n=1 Tax=Flavobacterium cerinum TaxID=2502784 RepID=A0A3S3QAJ7_9FLAO|nr:hypothetical protein [Flavobacterium cerinum]RWX03367.1 hypothetical protein EPI11_00110 [Flavobacterium cerinum]
MAKKTNAEKKAANVLAAHPEANEVYITSDNQAFFEKAKAYQHNKRKGITEEPEVFFREGYTYTDEEDDSDGTHAENQSLKEALQEASDALEDAKKEQENLVEELATSGNRLRDANNLLLQIESLTDLTGSLPSAEVFTDNPTALKVFQMRKYFEAIQQECEDLKANPLKQIGEIFNTEVKAAEEVKPEAKATKGK